MTCSSFSCNPGSYISTPCGGESPGVCQYCQPGQYQPYAGQSACITCASGTFQSNSRSSYPCNPCKQCSIGDSSIYTSSPCTTSSDSVCSEIPYCNPSTQYLLHNSTFAKCYDFTTCLATQYESVPPTASSDRTCLSITNCSFPLEYETSPPTHTTDRGCSTTTQCHNSSQATLEYELIPPTFTSNRMCANVTVCSPHQYTLSPPSATSNSRCANYSLCMTALSSYFMAVLPTPTSNLVCQTSRICNTTFQYLIAPSTASSDTVCGPLATCATGAQYEVLPPTLTTNRLCVQARVCNISNGKEYETKPLTPTSDRECALATHCNSTEFQAAPPSPTSDRLCFPLSSCSNTQNLYQRIPATSTSNAVCSSASKCFSPNAYEYSPLTPTSDRVCRNVTVCVTGQVVSKQPSATSDRICSNLTDISSTASTFSMTSKETTPSISVASSIATHPTFHTTPVKKTGSTATPSNSSSSASPNASMTSLPTATTTVSSSGSVMGNSNDAASSSGGGGSSGAVIPIAVGAAAGGACVFIIVLLILYYRYRRSRVDHAGERRYKTSSFDDSFSPQIIMNPAYRSDSLQSSSLEASGSPKNKIPPNPPLPKHPKAYQNEDMFPIFVNSLLQSSREGADMHKPPANAFAPSSPNYGNLESSSMNSPEQSQYEALDGAGSKKNWKGKKIEAGNTTAEASDTSITIENVTADKKERNYAPYFAATTETFGLLSGPSLPIEGVKTEVVKDAGANPSFGGDSVPYTNLVVGEAACMGTSMSIGERVADGGSNRKTEDDSAAAMSHPSTSTSYSHLNLGKPASRAQAQKTSGLPLVRDHSASVTENSYDVMRRPQLASQSASTSRSSGEENRYDHLHRPSSSSDVRDSITHSHSVNQPGEAWYELPGGWNSEGAGNYETPRDILDRGTGAGQTDGNSYAHLERKQENVVNSRYSISSFFGTRA